MAKKSSSLRTVIASGVIALVLVGGSIASLNLVSNDTNTQTNAWGGRLRLLNPAQPESLVVCWNRVIVSGTRMYWPNACKGRPGIFACAQVVVPLGEAEEAMYSKWVQAGRPRIAGCQDVPVQTASPRPIESKPTSQPYGTPPSLRFSPEDPMMRRYE